jgi:hypothetical protein
MLRTRLIAQLCLAFLVACATHVPPPPAQGSENAASGRFGDLRDLVLAEERELTPVRSRIGPRYPEDAKRQGIEAVVAAAFVVDTLGGIEPRSITFLGTPAAPPAFRASICEFLLSRAQFEPLIRDDRRRRAFVLQPFVFGLEGGRLYGVRPSATEQREAVRRTSWDSVVTILTKQPHCR